MTNLNIFDETLPPGWTLASPATYAYSPAPSAIRLGSGAESVAGIAPALPAQALTSLATTFPLGAAAPGTAAAAGQNSLRWGSFFLEQGASLTISFVVNIADSSPVGNYHNNAGASFLDPTRASADGNRLVTPAAANGTNRSNTSYSNNTAFAYASAGTVGGSNYNGLVAGPSSENVLLQGDLLISKTVSPVGTVSPGQTLTYTLTPRNNGRAIRDTTFAVDQTTSATNTDTLSRILNASTVRVTDTLPSGLTITTAFQGTGWSCSGTSSVVCDRTPAVVPLAAQTDLPVITGTVQVLSGACFIFNIATIGSFQAPYADSNVPNNSSSSSNTTTISNAPGCGANLSLTKSNGVTSPTSLVAGSTTNYTLTFSNGGPGVADGSIARDVPSSGLSNCSVTACTASGGSPVATCPIAANWPNILTGSGLALSNFPGGSTISFVVSCGVSATGL